MIILHDMTANVSLFLLTEMVYTQFFYLFFIIFTSIYTEKIGT
ncbi:putative membrane protein [Proteus mirabilis]|nr:putative membrane protein [Proteus mirabilis]